MNGWTPFKLKGWCNVLFMVLHAILRQIVKYCFCAISLRELSVCAIFYAFYNFGPQCYMYLSISSLAFSKDRSSSFVFIFPLKHP